MNGDQNEIIISGYPEKVIVEKDPYFIMDQIYENDGEKIKIYIDSSLIDAPMINQYDRLNQAISIECKRVNDRLYLTDILSEIF